MANKRRYRCGHLTIDEIKELRKQGKPWQVIKDFCGVAQSSFSKCLKRYNLSDGKRHSYKKRECRKSEVPQALARRDGYESLTDAIRALRLAGWTYAEVEEHYKGHGGLVRKYYPKDIRVHVVTEKLIKHAKEQCAMNNKKRKAGAYYTPKSTLNYIKGWLIANPTSGSGAFLKEAADKLEKGLTKNPPYTGKK